MSFRLERCFCGPPLGSGAPGIGMFPPGVDLYDGSSSSLVSTHHTPHTTARCSKTPGGRWVSWGWLAVEISAPLPATKFGRRSQAWAVEPKYSGGISEKTLRTRRLWHGMTSHETTSHDWKREATESNTREHAEPPWLARKRSETCPNSGRGGRS